MKLLLLLSLSLMAAASVKRGMGEQCFRAEECASNCCTAGACDSSEWSCAERRKEILFKIN